MTTLTVKTKGNAGAGVESIQMTSADIATELHNRTIGAGNAPEFMHQHIDQAFVDKYGFTAKFHSGTLLGYILLDEAGDDYYADLFDSLKK